MPAIPTMAPGPAAGAVAHGVVPSSRSDWIGAGLALLGSALLFLLSNSVTYGDALAYTKDIRAGQLLEPGHLAWRPLGYVAAALTGLLHSDSDVLWVLQWCSLLFSALAVAALWLFLRRRAGCGRMAAGAAAALMAVSNGFWVYSFSGSSYSLSVLLLIAAMGCASRAERPASARRALLVGALAGAAASSWAIQVLPLPALLLLLLLTPRWERSLWRLHVRNTCAMAGGWMLTFLLPLLAAYTRHAQQAPHGQPQAASAGLGSWLSSAGHGIPLHLSLAQLLRVAIGWPQSIVSTFGLGQGLRLWLLHEGSFPWSAWMLTPLMMYALAAFCAYRLLKSFRGRSHFEQGLIVASAVAIATNLLFALLWQGTDLERYFPSLPFQLLLFALSLQRATPTRRAIAVLVGALGFIAWINWQAAFLSVLSSHSERQIWLSQLHRVATGRDLLVVLGQNKFAVVSPHDPQMPKIHNLAIDIQLRGAGWKALVLRDVDSTLQHGGRVFLGDSLFGTDTAPRDGWSFQERPSPSPQEIQSVFLPFKSSTVAFTAGRERVWLAK
jgi:Dolichyl-phosphate-mannose-protein mannosyltransferase